eukprot:Gb_16696 [translate_table: standard]
MSELVEDATLAKKSRAMQTSQEAFISQPLGGFEEANTGRFISINKYGALTQYMEIEEDSVVKETPIQTQLDEKGKKPITPRTILPSPNQPTPEIKGRRSGSRRIMVMWKGSSRTSTICKDEKGRCLIIQFKEGVSNNLFKEKVIMVGDFTFVEKLSDNKGGTKKRVRREEREIFIDLKELVSNEEGNWPGPLHFTWTNKRTEQEEVKESLDRLYMSTEITNMEILVNGKFTKSFSTSEGIRQGCPISPYLFTIVAKGLSAMLCWLHQNGMIEGYLADGKRIFITHQLFANDLILIGKTSLSEVLSWEQALRVYKEATSQGLNKQKSSLLITGI